MQRALTRSALLLCLLSAHVPAVSPQGRDDRDLYEALLKDIFKGLVPSPLVVQAASLAHGVPSEADWRWFGPASAALQKAVDSTALPVMPFSVEAFPAGTHLVPRTAIDEIFRNAPFGKNPDDRWIPFRDRFKVRSYQGFSRPIVTKDGLEALIYYSHSCGALCGEAGYAWLRRAAGTEPWTVVKRLPKVVS